MKWIKICACLLALAVSTASASSAPQQQPTPPPDLYLYLTPQTLATLPDGRHIHLFCMGTGEPLTILAPGWHVEAFWWHHMQVLMAKKTRVCVYERAGYSFSDPGPIPRDTAAEVKDLHEALQSSGLKGPYVLVGHSLGGFDARLFAYTYPKETAGLLLLDPPTERIYQHTREPDEDIALVKQCETLVRTTHLVQGGPDGCLDTKLGPEFAAFQAKLEADHNRASWFETIYSEDVSMVTRSADELVAARRPLGAIPLVVLQADTNCPSKGRKLKTEGETFDAQRCAELLSQARDSTHGERRIVKGASHMINHDKPEVVLDAFDEVVQTARSSGLATAEPH
jgi:pimeloyl-ACP methyl ester carboxylesterase